jgi:hypothetical protein
LLLEVLELLPLFLPWLWCLPELEAEPDAGAEADVLPLDESVADAISGAPANEAARMVRTATLNFILRSFQMVNRRRKGGRLHPGRNCTRGQINRNLTAPWLT